MAHLIDSMAYVGELPWHKLGTRLPNLATADEMRIAAGLDWPVVTEPIYTADIVQITGWQLTRRVDTGAILGVMGDGYTPAQNGDCFRFMDNLTMDPNGPKYETAGSISGGKRVWALARWPEAFDVLPGDTVAHYLLITTGHDGRNALRVLPTDIRVVCNNTLTAATSDESKGVRIVHAQDMLSKVEDARIQLGMYRKDMEATEDLYRMLARKQVSVEDCDIVLKALFGEASTEAKRDGVGAKRTKVMELSEAGLGSDVPGIRGTAWGFYNAIAEYCDHYHGASSKADGADDRRLESIWFGSTIPARKEAALELLARI